KAGYNISGFPASAQVILKALKKYGVIVADNGGNWFIIGAPDARWPDDEINELKKVKGSDFEAVLSVDNAGKPIYPPGMGIVQFAPLRPGAETGPVLDLMGRRLREPPQAALPLVRAGDIWMRLGQ